MSSVALVFVERKFIALSKLRYGITLLSITSVNKIKGRIMRRYFAAEENLTAESCLFTEAGIGTNVVFTTSDFSCKVYYM